MYSLSGLWVVDMLSMTGECDGPEADCQECNWSVAEPTRQAALDAAKEHRRKSGHLVVLRGA